MALISRFGVAAALALLAWTLPADARVIRIVIDATVDVAGQPSYEQLTGRAWGELDPGDPKNALVTDIELAPKNANGKVEYIASFRIRKPKDMGLASGLLWHDVPNRGGNVNLTPDLFAAGDAQLLSGWQGDNAGATAVPANAHCIPPYVAPCDAPAFNNHYVKSPVLTGVTGRIFARIINKPFVATPRNLETENPTNQPLNVMGNPIPYFPADSANNSDAVLKTRTFESINGNFIEGPTIPNSEWKFCYGAAATFVSPGSPTSLPVRVCLGNGRTFDPAILYQLEYTVKDPYVLGAGTAAFRDVQSFFRYEAADDFGTANPLAGQIKWAIIRGSSQSGNFTRHFIHLGMNQDEAGRIVHEGAWPLIAGRRVANNSRWGQPDGVLELYQMGSEGPQWWARYQDPVRGLPARGILDRCSRTGTCPKVVETFGGAEVFALKMTPSWVGTDAKRDIPLPENVRRYYLPSSTHGGGNGQTTQNPAGPSSTPPVFVNCPGNNWGRGTLLANPVPASGRIEMITNRFLPYGLVDRMRAALRDWVMHDTPPPPSRWPTLRDKTLVEPTKAAMGFPSSVPGIPDSIFRPENFVFPVFDYDWGRDYDHSEANGVPTNAPPPIRSVIKALVPRVDADGNELGGVPTVQRDAPLGTYLGWNITAGPGDTAVYDGRPFHQGQVCNYVGGMIPFAKTRAQRLATIHPETGQPDPRLSLEERYGNHAGYVAAVINAASNAFNQGYLLAEGREILIQQARDSDVLCTAFDALGKCIDPAP